MALRFTAIENWLVYFSREFAREKRKMASASSAQLTKGVILTREGWDGVECENRWPEKISHNAL